MKKVSAKQVIQSDNWIITKALAGRGGVVRIDARTRFHIADGQNFFSEWRSLKYINRLRKEAGKTDLKITNY